MAAVSLFWNTNMASVTSCENALLVILTLHLRLVCVVSKSTVGMFWNEFPFPAS